MPRESALAITDSLMFLNWKYCRFPFWDSAIASICIRWISLSLAFRRLASLRVMNEPSGCTLSPPVDGWGRISVLSEPVRPPRRTLLGSALPYCMAVGPEMIASEATSIGLNTPVFPPAVVLVSLAYCSACRGPSPAIDALYSASVMWGVPRTPASNPPRAIARSLCPWIEPSCCSCSRCMRLAPEMRIARSASDSPSIGRRISSAAVFSSASCLPAAMFSSSHASAPALARSSV